MGVGENGSELKLPGPKDVKVSGRVAAYLEPEPTQAAPEEHPSRVAGAKAVLGHRGVRIGKTRQVPVEVVVNGYPVARKEIAADGTFRDVAFEVPIDGRAGSRCESTPPHTNPIFVLVDGKPIGASKDRPSGVSRGVDQCWSQKKSTIRPAEGEEARKGV